MKESVIIIGAGLGGLYTGAILAKEGLHVTVLEKNATIGGGLQSFTRFGETFDTGMHVFGGMQQGGNVRKICQYLGILDEINIRDVDDDCTDRLYFAEDHTYYNIGKGKEGFVASLAKVFPQEEENLKRYVEALYQLTSQIDLFNLRPSNGQTNLFNYSEEFMLSAEGFIAQYVNDRRLRSVLAYMNPLYGGRRDQTPAYVHAIISTLYINGASRFVDGSHHFANALAKVITDHGGQVLANEGVSWIEVNDRHVDFVKTKKGNTYTADYYISDIHPCTLLTLMNEKAFPKSYRDRLNSIPNAYSAFALYIKLKKDTFQYINHSEFYMTRYDDVWNFGQRDKAWPLGFLFMTPPDNDQTAYATKVLVTAPMAFEEVSQWADTTVGHRGDDYLKWKEEKAAVLLQLIEDIHPGFSQCIEAINTSSPLTIRDFCGVKEGSMFGFSKDYKNIVLSQVPVVTKVSNLLLTGQNNNLHGFCGVPLTAIITSEVILGQNVIVNKINGI